MGSRIGVSGSNPCISGKRAARVGFDWSEVHDVVSKIDEETAEMKRALAAGELNGLPGAPPILLKGFTLPGEDGNAGLGDGGGSVILGGEDVAGDPADIGTEFGESLDEYGRLDGHVERTHDSHAF
jgi:hypothetical protein